MKADIFRAWLRANYSSNAAATHLSQAKKVERAYGDLDDIIDEGRVDEIATELNYSSEDARLGRPSKAKIDAGSNPYANLASYKSSLRCYAKFRASQEEFESESTIEAAGRAIAEKIQGKQFELERHLQAELRRELAQLENGLSAIDDGMERSVASGFIDILARDPSGALVVIELKAGLARRDAVGQITGYMGDLCEEEPGATVRGILVAAEFDKSCEGAVRVIPGLQLKRYRFSFAFEDA